MLSDIFKENGKLSYMRVASFIALLNGIGVGWYSLIIGKSPLETLTAIGIWVVAAFVPKALQKIVEVKGAMPIFGGIPSSDSDIETDSPTPAPAQPPVTPTDTTGTAR